MEMFADDLHRINGKERESFTSDSVGQDIVVKLFADWDLVVMFSILSCEFWDGGETKKNGGGGAEMWEWPSIEEAYQIGEVFGNTSNYILLVVFGKLLLFLR